jgi:ribosomal protein L40E
MASTNQSGAGGTKFCHDCDARTPHDISLEIVTGSHDPDDGAKFPHEPSRVTACRRCGTANRTWMNNA